MKKQLLITIPSLLLLLAAGCSRDSAISCRKAAAHYGEMVNRELAKEADAERLKQARLHLPTLQNAVLETCESAKWPESVRQCIVNAKLVAELAECDPAGAIPTPEPQ